MANIKELLKTSGYNSARSILKSAGELGNREGIELYVVGGFVRDLLMGVPVNDIDIMTIGEGIPFAKKFAKILGVKKVVSFEKFGTALIPNNNIQIEIVTARTEDYDSNSRKPSRVKYTDLSGERKTVCALRGRGHGEVSGFILCDCYALLAGGEEE